MSNNTTNINFDTNGGELTISNSAIGSGNDQQSISSNRVTENDQQSISSNRVTENDQQSISSNRVTESEFFDKSIKDNTVTKLIKNIQKQKTKKIHIFLASSSELEKDRKSFEIFINRQNKIYFDQGVFLELNLYEDFLDAMSQRRLQDEYNKVIQNCDIFISLFWTKVGKYSEEEFTKAFEVFQENGKPLIFTYFKSAEINTADLTDDVITLLKFKKKLQALGHFSTTYSNASDLEMQFSRQLQKCLPRLIH